MMNSDNLNNTFFLPDEDASTSFAKIFASRLRAPLIITFNGALGAGKTTIIRAMLRALGVQSAIKSPTFSIVESYSCPEFVVHHFDLYRINNPEELEYIGFRDFFAPKTVCCIEWAERADYLLPHTDISCTLTMKEEGRELVINSLSAAGNEIITDAQFLGY